MADQLLQIRRRALTRRDLFRAGAAVVSTVALRHAPIQVAADVDASIAKLVQICQENHALQEALQQLYLRAKQLMYASTMLTHGEDR